MANDQHLHILNKGFDIWNDWRRKHPDIKPDLRSARLQGTDLSRFNLIKADLSDADLSESNLRAAFLTGANLTRAHLIEANLFITNLRQATLVEANLMLATLHNVVFAEADITAATFGKTIISSVDLSQVNGLETVFHSGPSSIGIDTIYNSNGNIPEEFLRGAGVPDQIIAYVNSLVGQPIEYYSAFISYSHKDEEFANRIFADLQNNNVRTWYAPEDLKIGDKFRQRIDESIRLHDKLLLILSEHSVSSDWVEQEVETALAKEREQKSVVLFPVMVDNSVMEIKTGWPALIKNNRHIGDFRKWKDHDSYQEAFQRLLRDLKAADGNSQKGS